MQKGTRNAVGGDGAGLSCVPLEVLISTESMAQHPSDAAVTPMSTSISPAAVAEAEKPIEASSTPGTRTRDVEALHYSDDKVLLGHRSCAETLVLCIANLIPPLGVA